MATLVGGGLVYLASQGDGDRAAACERPPETRELWHDDVNEQDIQRFVHQVLGDKSLNMTMVPDVVEEQLYAFTVKLVLGAIYSSLGSLDGMSFMAGHELTLVRKRDRAEQIEADAKIQQQNTGIDETILEQIADKLLLNSAINSTLIPDFVERQLYMNCLKLLFRLLDTVANTFCITLCGHDLRLHFEPSVKMLHRVSAISSSTKIDDGALAKALEVSGSGEEPPSLLMKELMKGVYSLVLGITDDVLANTELRLLNDRIRIDVIPAASSPTKRKRTSASSSSSKTKSPIRKEEGNGTSAGTALTFTAGVCVGIASSLLWAKGSRT